MGYGRGYLDIPPEAAEGMSPAQRAVVEPPYATRLERPVGRRARSAPPNRTAELRHRPDRETPKQTRPRSSDTTLVEPARRPSGPDWPQLDPIGPEWPRQRHPSNATAPTAAPPSTTSAPPSACDISHFPPPPSAGDLAPPTPPAHPQVVTVRADGVSGKDVSDVRPVRRASAKKEFDRSLFGTDYF